MDQCDMCELQLSCIKAVDDLAYLTRAILWLLNSLQINKYINQK